MEKVKRNYGKFLFFFSFLFTLIFTNASGVFNISELMGINNKYGIVNAYAGQPSKPIETPKDGGGGGTTAQPETANKLIIAIKTVIISIIVIFALIGILKEVKNATGGSGGLAKIISIAGVAIFLIVMVIFISGGGVKNVGEGIGDKAKTTVETDLKNLIP